MTASASTPKGERRRAALIDAASALLDEGGFDAVRHRAVAERAGLPLASTTYYFDSLDELVLAAVRYNAERELAACRDRLDALRAEPGTQAAVVEFLLDALLGRSSDVEAVVLRYEKFVTAARRPWLAPLMRELRVELDTIMHAALAHAGFTAGKERLDLLVAVVDGAVVNALIESVCDPRDAARRMLSGMLVGP